MTRASTGPRRGPCLLALLLVVVAALTTACRGDGSGAAAPATSPVAACPTPAAPPATNGDGTVTTAQGERTYQVWTPPGYDGRTPLPTILLFHGTAGAPAVIGAFTGLTTAAPARGYLVVAPQGLTEPGARTPRWTVPGFGTQPDDVAFTAAMLDDVAHTYCVDQSRVYATGFSSGGAFTQYLSCRLPERFAALAPLAGANLVRDCPTAEAVPWISFHGTDDLFVSFHGNPTNPADPNAAYFGDIEKTADAMAVRNGCRPGRVDASPAPDAVRRTYAGCRADTELLVMKGAGHTFPGSAVSKADDDRGTTIMDVDGVDLLLDFFDVHVRAVQTAR